MNSPKGNWALVKLDRQNQFIIWLEKSLREYEINRHFLLQYSSDPNKSKLNGMLATNFYAEALESMNNALGVLQNMIRENNPELVYFREFTPNDSSKNQPSDRESPELSGGDAEKQQSGIEVQNNEGECTDGSS